MHTLKKIFVTAAALTFGVGSQAGEVSANIGVTSDYIWRGASQSEDSASVSGGVDYSDESGFYAGTWIGSLGKGSGSELDLYAGYATDTFDVGYIYYMYPTDDDINFGEIYGSATFGAFTVGLAYTTNNDSGNDGAYFVDGDLYYYVSAGTDISEDWSVGFTLGQYDFDLAADYVHYQVDFGTSTDMGDFTFTLSDTDQDGDDFRAIVSWGIGF